LNKEIEMRLVNEHAPNQKFATSAGLVESDSAGCLEVRDPAFAAALMKSGWKEDLGKKKAAPAAKVEEPVAEAVEEAPEAEEAEEVAEEPAPVQNPHLTETKKADSSKPKWMRSK
jgi:hypothetical protein